MTTYYPTLFVEYANDSFPTATTLNISSADTIVVSVETGTFAAGGTWTRWAASGCTVTPLNGLDGEQATIIPTGGATSYSVTFRAYDDGDGTFYYGRIAGTISAPVVTPTYSVGNASTNEGASATANVTTTNVANGTTLYWTVDATTADVSITSGSFTINTNTGSFTVPAIADSLTEGTEFYTISVRTGSTAGTVVATSTLTINDTSTTPAATYALTFYTSGFVQTSTFNEGDSFYVFINTTGVPNGTYYWSTSSGSDLVAPVNGSFLIDANFGSLYLTIAADSLTEGAESLTIYIRSGSISGTILGSSSITINDTSVAAVDNTPDAFAFTSATGQTISSTTTSGTTTVTGMSAGISITITSSNCTIDAGTSTLSGTFAASKTVTTSGTGTLVLAIRVTNSASNNTPTTGTATINGVSGTFTSTTIAGTDTIPNAFIFADQNDVAVSSTIVSSEIEILGINTGAPISITGGQYSIGIDPTTYTPYTSAAGTIYNTQTVKVRHTSSSANNTPTSTTLIIGGVSDVFTSTTIGAVGSGNYGLIVYDTLGNIMLDTTDITIKDLGMFSVASVTTNGTITGVPLTSNSIALVTNNNGDGDTAIAAPAVTLAPASSSIVVSGGLSGFNVSIRVMEF